MLVGSVRELLFPNSQLARLQSAVILCERQFCDWINSSKYVSIAEEKKNKKPKLAKQDVLINTAAPAKTSLLLFHKVHINNFKINTWQAPNFHQPPLTTDGSETVWKAQRCILGGAHVNESHHSWDLRFLSCQTLASSPRQAAAAVRFDITLSDHTRAVTAEDGAVECSEPVPRKAKQIPAGFLKIQTVRSSRG